MTAALVSIIGPPGVGKTTLATLLAGDLDGRLILEDYAGNPFLAPSWRGVAGAALPAQLYFLMSRAGQLAAHAWPALGLAVSDYGFCQDDIFASLSLEAQEYAIYGRVAQSVVSAIVQPAVLVCLRASPSTLIERIGQRGRQFEQAMHADFLEGIMDRCEQSSRQSQCPVLRLDCDNLDLRQDCDRRPVVDEIRRLTGE
jgi:deoxyadenosine/deoxycytidine kinase